MGIQGLNPQRPSLVNRIFGRSSNNGPAMGNGDPKKQKIIEKTDANALSIFTGLYSLITLPGILINQIENMVTMGSRHMRYDPESNKEKPGALGLYSKFLELISFVKPFNKPTDPEFLKHKTEENPKGHVEAWMDQVNPNVAINDPNNQDVPESKRRKGLWGVWQRLIHPTTARVATSAIFGVGSILKNIFEGIPKDLNDPITSSINLFRRGISVVGGIFQSPGTFLGSIFSFYGRQELVQASSLWGLAGGILMGACANLSGLVKSIVTVKDMAKNNKTLGEAMRDQGINSGHFVQALLGGLTAPLSLPGMFARIFQIVKNVRDDIVPSARAVGNLVATRLHELNFMKDTSVKDFEDKGEGFAKGAAAYLREVILPWVEILANKTPFLAEGVFKKLLATDERGNISFATHANILKDIENYGTEAHISAKDDPDRYKDFYGLPTSTANSKKDLLLGFIPKGELGLEIFKALGPLQAAMMMLPPALSGFKDNDIQKHGIMPMRLVDRVMGLVNGLLTLPNYLTLVMSTRLPQMITYYYDVKQRKARANGDTQYDAMNDLVKFRDRLRKSSIFPFADYLASIIDADIINNVYGNDVFKDSDKTNKLITMFFERSAFKQEYAAEAPMAVEYIRNLMKLGINNFKFLRITVDPTKMTPADKGKKIIHDFLEKIHHIVSAVPGGVLLAPVLGILMKPFEISELKKAGSQAEPIKGLRNPFVKPPAKPANGENPAISA